MLSINSITEQYQPIPLKVQKTAIRSERAYIISQFVEAINVERIGTKFKPITGRAVAIKLGILKTNQELYEFLSECKDYKNRHDSFGKRFFGGFKTRIT